MTIRRRTVDGIFEEGSDMNIHPHRLVTGIAAILAIGMLMASSACGTGGGSVACVLWLEGKLPESTLTAHSRGGTLKYTVSGGNGVVTSLLLEGPTEVVRTYEL